MADAHAVVASDLAGMPASVRVGDASVSTWPEGQRLDVLVPGRIVITRFDDARVYHAALRDAVLAAHDDGRFRDAKAVASHAACGTKVRDVEAWGSPAAALVHARALVLAHFVLDRGPVFADDTWASVFRRDDYCPPHSHVRADVSIVYMLDPGDDADLSSGRLFLMDPRIEWCCPLEPGRATRPLVPDMAPGSMIVFAGELLHSVTPYGGGGPRITLSWNVTRTRRAPDPRVPTGRASPRRA